MPKEVKISDPRKEFEKLEAQIQKLTTLLDNLIHKKAGHNLGVAYSSVQLVAFAIIARVVDAYGKTDEALEKELKDFTDAARYYYKNRTEFEKVDNEKQVG